MRASIALSFLFIGLALSQQAYFLYFDEKNGKNEGNNCQDGNNPCRSFAVMQSAGYLVDQFAGVNDTLGNPTLSIVMSGTFNSRETLSAVLSSQNPVALSLVPTNPSAPVVWATDDGNIANFSFNGLGSIEFDNFDFQYIYIRCDSAYVWLSNVNGKFFTARGYSYTVRNSHFDHAAYAIWAYRELLVDSCSFSQPSDDSVQNIGAGIALMPNDPYSAIEDDDDDTPLNLQVLNSTFSHNVGIVGGAIQVTFPNSTKSLLVFIDSCTFKNNWADEGGAVHIVHPNPNITINTSFFSSNRAHRVETFGGSGGGVYVGGLKVHPNHQTIQILDSHFNNNTAFAGGAIWMKYWGGDFSGTKLVGNSLPDLTFEDGTECRTNDCSLCGGNICTKLQSFDLCYGPPSGPTSYTTCDGSDNIGKICVLSPDRSQQCQCPPGTKGKNCDEIDGTSVSPQPTERHDPGNHPGKPNHTALIVVLTLLGLAVFSGALYGYFYYRSRNNYQAL